jgi:hypothetical protein
VPFISEATHKQFLKHYEVYLERQQLSELSTDEQEVMQSLGTDVSHLNEILKSYSATCTVLQKVVRDYQDILKRARVNMRKMQVSALSRKRAAQKLASRKTSKPAIEVEMVYADDKKERV